MEKPCGQWKLVQVSLTDHSFSNFFFSQNFILTLLIQFSNWHSNVNDYDHNHGGLQSLQLLHIHEMVNIAVHAI